MNTDKLLYWSPAFRWEIVEGRLKIEMFQYDGKFAELFPEFYFLTQKGIKNRDLLDALESKNVPGVHNFVKDLFKRQILITDPLEIQQLVFIQNHLFDNQYGDEIKYDANALANFKEVQLNRNPVEEAKILDEIEIPDQFYPAEIENRKSVRNFDKGRLVNKENFFKIISVLRQKKGEEKHYYYASAGGLYPIDIYVFVKENRIEDVSGGFYYYSPRLNRLQKISKGREIDAESQYFLNKDIFDGSAFSIYFVYDASVSMPKYGGMAYIYSCIDTGIMVSLLTFISEMVGIGSCSIGEMNYKKIKSCFPLSPTMSFLHSMEFGIEKL